MMNSLTGRLPSTIITDVQKATALRFRNPNDFVTPESLIIHEQRILDDEVLLDLCMQEYPGIILEAPHIPYIPKDIIDYFEKFRVIVLDYEVNTKTVVLGTIPEFKDDVIIIDDFQYRKKLVPLFFYVDVYQRQYGEPDFLAPLPTIDLLHFVYREAINMGASDITITTTSKGAKVYYNARKHIVPASRQINKDDVDTIAASLAAGAGSAMDSDVSDARPRYFSIDIDKQNRGRVVINKTYYGRLITIRVLPNKVLTETIENLNLNEPTCKFLREHFLSREKGLRLFIGETMSGKNTSILATLNELVHTGSYKIVSVEQPVEILVDGIEQINAETDEEFRLNADSLLRQNPDMVYFTEITARTSEAVMQQANTAKAVFSTIHANSISDVLFRLEDITHMSLDRLILTLQSCIYQELVRDDKLDKVFPYTRCVYFSDELKMKLYGQDIATIKSTLQEVENDWEMKYNSVNRGLVNNSVKKESNHVSGILQSNSHG